MKRLAFFLVLSAYSLIAQTTAWDNLRKLTPDQQVEVLLKSGEWRKGRFQSYDADNISLRDRSGAMGAGRVEVERVTVPKRSHRVRNALIGGGIGAAVGLVIDKSVGAYLHNEVGYSSGTRVLIWTAPIGIGAGLGAALSGQQTIYRSPRR